MRLLKEIVFHVAKKHGVTERQVKSKGRFPEFMRCRREIVSVARSEGYQLTEIARQLKRSRKTVSRYVEGVK